MMNGFSPVVVFLTVGGAVGLAIVIFFSVFYAQQRSEAQYQSLPTEDDEDAFGDRQRETERSLMSNHTPCTLLFRELCYIVDLDSKSTAGRSRADEATPIISTLPIEGAHDRLVVLNGVEGIGRNIFLLFLY